MRYSTAAVLLVAVLSGAILHRELKRGANDAPLPGCVRVFGLVGLVIVFSGALPLIHPTALC